MSKVWFYSDEPELNSPTYCMQCATLTRVVKQGRSIWDVLQPRTQRHLKGEYRYETEPTDNVCAHCGGDSPGNAERNV
jgi:hypothetical protein